jgi:hypothetical protein
VNPDDNFSMLEQPVESSSKQINESATCEICGHFGAVEAGDRWLCIDCYQGCGACCSEAQTGES